MIEEGLETGLEIAVIGMAGRFPGAGSRWIECRKYS
jgi:hypothetical protein